MNSQIAHIVTTYVAVDTIRQQASVNRSSIAGEYEGAAKAAARLGEPDTARTLGILADAMRNGWNAARLIEQLKAVEAEGEDVAA